MIESETNAPLEPRAEGASRVVVIEEHSGELRYYAGGWRSDESRIHLEQDRVVFRGREAGPAEARVQAFEGPQLLQPFAFSAVLDPARRNQPLRGKRGVGRVLAAQMARHRPGSQHREDAIADRDILEVDQRAGPRRTAGAGRTFADPHHFFEIEPAAAVFLQVDARTGQGDAREDDPLPDQVGQLEAQLHPRRRSEREARGVSHHDAVEREPGEEIPLDSSDRNGPAHQRGRTRGDHFGEQAPARPRESQREQGAEHRGHRADDDDEEEASHRDGEA